MCNVKVVAHSLFELEIEEENYHPTQQFLSAHCFVVTLIVLFHGVVFSKKAIKNHCTLPAEH